MDSSVRTILENIKDLPIEYSTYPFEDIDLWNDGLPREKDVLRIDIGTEQEHWWQDDSIMDMNPTGIRWFPIYAINLPMDITFITKGRYEYHIAFREYFFWRSRFSMKMEFKYLNGSAKLYRRDRRTDEVVFKGDVDDEVVSDFTSRPFEEWLLDTYHYLADVMRSNATDMSYVVEKMDLDMMYVKNTYTYLWWNTYLQKYGKDQGDCTYEMDEEDDKEFLEWYDRNERNVPGWYEPRSVWSVI